MESRGTTIDAFALLRGWILAVLVLALAGTATELVLLEHYEQGLQLVPLVLIAAACIAIVWRATRMDVASLRAMEVIMILFVVAGFAGVVAHFHGSAEFQLELDPAMDIRQLVEKVMRAKAPPLLAPGMMLQMGLLGLGYVYTDASNRARLARWLGSRFGKGVAR
jgi:hypothetical protein